MAFIKELVEDCALAVDIDYLPDEREFDKKLEELEADQN